MKKVIFGLLVIFAFVFKTSAQNCPEFQNMISGLKADGSLIDLEQAKSSLKQQKKGLYRGYDNSIRLEGASSGVIISANNPVFMFKPLNLQVQPNQQINLYYFDQSKSFRSLSTGGTNMFGGSKNKKASDTSSPIKISKVSDGCYKVTIATNLEPGEYAFVVGTNVDVQGSSVGFGQSVTGQQAWYAFTVK